MMKLQWVVGACVVGLLATALLAEQNQVQPAPQSQPQAPATAPATQPSDAGPGGTSAAPTRTVTPEEINHIRQIEWDRRETMRITIDRDVRNRFLSGSEVTPAQFQQFNANEQAIQILDKGKPELADGVHILSDPASIVAYKARVQKVVVSGCATAGCHGGKNAKGGSFYLFTTGDATKETYTNYLILQTFRQEVDKVQLPLVNRQFPEKSLLLQYMLPRNVAETPHPDVPNFKAMVKTTRDVRFQQTLEWIRSLNSIVPSYGVDLTQEPEKKPPPGRNTR